MDNEKEQQVKEISIKSDEDVIFVRQEVRNLAKQMGLSLLEQTRIVTAASELGRNIVVHAREGKAFLIKVEKGDRQGLKIVFRDKGPGIPDVQKALEEGFSTVGSLGLGLPGARRLVDDFAIESSPLEGTTVIIIKWR